MKKLCYLLLLTLTSLQCSHPNVGLQTKPNRTTSSTQQTNEVNEIKTAADTLRFLHGGFDTTDNKREVVAEGFIDLTNNHANNLLNALLSFEILLSVFIFLKSGNVFLKSHRTDTNS